MIHNTNKTKDKHHLITQQMQKKAFDKTEHPFMTKTLNKVDIG